MKITNELISSVLGWWFWYLDRGGDITELSNRSFDQLKDLMDLINKEAENGDFSYFTYNNYNNAKNAGPELLTNIMLLQEACKTSPPLCAVLLQIKEDAVRWLPTPITKHVLKIGFKK